MTAATRHLDPSGALAREPLAKSLPVQPPDGEGQHRREAGRDRRIIGCKVVSHERESKARRARRERHAVYGGAVGAAVLAADLGALVAGLIGERKAGGFGPALGAAVIPAVVVSALIFLVGALFDLPVIGGLVATATWS